jgi:hypothetical protein
MLIVALSCASLVAARDWPELQREGGHRGVTEVEIVTQAEEVGEFGLFATPAGTVFAESGPVVGGVTVYAVSLEGEVAAVPGGSETATWRMTSDGVVRGTPAGVSDQVALVRHG